MKSFTSFNALLMSLCSITLSGVSYAQQPAQDAKPTENVENVDASADAAARSDEAAADDAAAENTAAEENAAAEEKSATEPSSEQAAPEQPAAEQTAQDATSPAEQPSDEKSAAVAPVAAASESESSTSVAGDATVAPAASASVVAVSVESEPAAKNGINPRPAGEEERLGKHVVDGSNFSFKPGTGFVFESNDKQFSMGVRLRVQFRNETLVQKVINADGEEETAIENQFGIRRARVQFKGHMWGENNKYKLELAFSPRDLGLKPIDLGRVDGNPTRTPLLTWYTEHTQLRDLSLRIGQYKLYYNRQRVVSSGDLAFVDRSEAQGEFNLDRDIGLHFFSKDLFGLGFLKYYAGLSIGEGRDIWESENLADGEDPSYQVLGRLEILPFGDFVDYSESDFERLNKVRASLGGAIAYLKHGRREMGYLGSAWDDGGTVDYTNVTADLLVKWAGLSLFGEFFYRKGERDSEIAPGDFSNLPRSGFGATGQADFLLPYIPVNVGFRYSTVKAGNFDTSIQENTEIGGTVGWYIAGHPLKLQADYFHLMGDDFPESDADRVRVQLQAAF